MNITPIRTEADYRAALAQASRWFDNEPGPGSADADAFTTLLALIEAHEAEHVPIDLLDPVRVIHARLGKNTTPGKSLK